MADPIAPVGQLRGEHLRALTSTSWWRAAIVLVPVLVGVVAILVVADQNPVLVFVLAAAVTAAAGAIGTYLLAHERAQAAFVRAWARSRGWTEDTGAWQDEATPLLREGDRRGSENHVSGQLANGSEATLCHYTYEVKRTSRSSSGSTTTHWEDHPFTVVATQVAAGIERLTLHPRSFGDIRLFDQIDSALTSDRVVELESSELEREYKLEVVDSASDEAVRLLFEPAFMMWCLDQAGDSMLFEIEHGTLVVVIPDHSYDAGQLDALVDRATTIAARLADAQPSDLRGLLR